MHTKVTREEVKAPGTSPLPSPNCCKGLPPAGDAPSRRRTVASESAGWRSGLSARVDAVRDDASHNDSMEWMSSALRLGAMVKSIGGVVKRLSGVGGSQNDLPKLLPWLWTQLLRSWRDTNTERDLLHRSDALSRLPASGDVNCGPGARGDAIVGCPQAAACELLFLLHAVGASTMDSAITELKRVCAMGSLDAESKGFAPGANPPATRARIWMAYSLWVPKGCRVDRGYASCVSHRFGAEVFCRKAAGEFPSDVSEWVKINSDCKLLRPLPSLPSRGLTLVSCVRVRGAWMSPFEERETAIGRFVKDGREKDVHMMRKEGRMLCRDGKVRVVPFPCCAARLSRKMLRREGKAPLMHCFFWCAGLSCCSDAVRTRR